MPHRPDGWPIMIAVDEVNAALEPVEVALNAGVSAHGKIAEVPDRVSPSDDGIPVVDEAFIHFIGVPERTAAETKDILVPKMGVGGEPGFRHDEDLGRQAWIQGGS